VTGAGAQRDYGVADAETLRRVASSEAD